MDIQKEVLPQGTVVYTNAQHKVSTDALLLADFCECKRSWSAYDLGTGSGVVLLSLVDKGLQGQCVGIEISSDGASLMQASVEENKLQEQIAVVEGDLRSYSPTFLADIVTANPPYFCAGLHSPKTERAQARHETHGGIGDFCSAAARMLKDKGRFCVCFVPNRLAELMDVLRQNRLEPKRMRFCRKAHDAEPWLVLVDARKAGGAGLAVLPDFILPPGKACHY